MKSSLVIIFICFGLVALSQEKTDSSLSSVNDNLAIGLFGQASIYSLNYHILNIKKRYLRSIQFGLGLTTKDPLAMDLEAIVIPINYTLNFGSRNYLELGDGISIIPQDKELVNYFIIGYRLHPLELYKITFCIFLNIPIFYLSNDSGFLLVRSLPELFELPSGNVIFPFGLRLGISI